jgi:hypothetical protein
MTLSRTRAALAIIETQVAALNLDSFTQSCLAQYLAVTFYAEMEERISEVITNQLQKFTNSLIGRFLTANMEKIIRRTPKSDIVDLLGNLGEEFKIAFNKLVTETDVSLYSNLITARHGVGHRRGSNVTVSDIRYGIAAGEKILMALDSCFNTDNSTDSPSSGGTT